MPENRSLLMALVRRPDSAQPPFICLAPSSLRCIDNAANDAEDSGNPADQLECARFGTYEIAITASTTAIQKADADEPFRLLNEGPSAAPPNPHRLCGS